MASDDKPQPKWSDSGVPNCAREDCAHYDGKRCELMGFKPDAICEPAVEDMQAALEAADRLADETERGGAADAMTPSQEAALAAYRKARQG